MRCGLPIFQGAGLPIFKKVSAELNTELQPHQQRVADKIKQRSQLVAHGTGTGKTLSSIAGGVGLGQPMTAIVPTSLVGNYGKEIKKHVKGDMPVEVTSIGKAINRQFQPQPGTVVIDEAHGIRNPEAQRFKYLQDVLTPEHRVMLLTGTPAYNSVSDIAPLINTVRGDKALPTNKADFDKEYVHLRKVHPGILDRIMGVQSGEVAELKNKDRLEQIMDGYVDYHETSQDENFPERIDEEIRVPMSPSQHQAYKYVEGGLPGWARRKIRRNLPPSKAEAKSLNAFMTGLRQTSLSEAPYVHGLTPLEAAERSPKLQRALEEIRRQDEEDKNFRAFVYSNYLEAGLKPMQAALAARNIPSEILHGGLSAKQRTDLVNSYNAGDLKVLLGSSAAAEGLDLKGTKLVQVLDPHFNNSRIEQAVARGIRYKSHLHLPEDERNVRVQRYVSEIPPSIWDFLRKRPAASDDNLMSRAAEKDKLNQELKEIMRKVT